MRALKNLSMFLAAATLAITVGCAAGADESGPDAARVVVESPDDLETEAMKPPKPPTTPTPTQNCCFMGTSGTCCCTAPMRCEAEEGVCLCKN